MKKKLVIWVSVLVLTTYTLNGQIKKQDLTQGNFFIGSTFFMLGNLVPTNTPDFVQLNFGYRVKLNNVISVEAKTWKYAWPLGIPYGKSFEAPEEKFPGYIREYGIAIAYQRFWWKGLYTAIHIMQARQTFVDDNGDKIKNGYQMFNTYRLGYQLKFFNNRFFIEPSIAVTHRPIYTKMPQSFTQLNNKWPNYFIGEPGLHFGINF
ncbi:MAG: hypothetical protein Q8M15_04150 [Bacteroidota bacterium]|nr:hypothetical protein [Bacteroidota bacterium]